MFQSLSRDYRCCNLKLTAGQNAKGYHVSIAQSRLPLLQHAHNEIRYQGIDVVSIAQSRLPLLQPGRMSLLSLDDYLVSIAQSRLPLLQLARRLAAANVRQGFNRSVAITVAATLRQGPA